MNPELNELFEECAMLLDDVGIMLAEDDNESQGDYDWDEIATLCSDTLSPKEILDCEQLASRIWGNRKSRKEIKKYAISTSRKNRFFWNYPDFGTNTTYRNAVEILFLFYCQTSSRVIVKERDEMFMKVVSDIVLVKGISVAIASKTVTIFNSLYERLKPRITDDILIRVYHHVRDEKIRVTSTLFASLSIDAIARQGK